MSKYSCRFCGTSLEHVFVDLGVAPLSNALLNRDQLDQKEVFYPLKVYVCDSCLLVQLPQHERPEIIFHDYVYFSSYSESWLEHCKRYADLMISAMLLTAHSQVIEVASNDGYLLQYFKQKGIPVLGIEPAENVAHEAIKKGIATRTVFFGSACAESLRAECVSADLLIANNVLAHVPDLNDFIKGMVILLKSNGVITLEFPHLLKLIEKCEYDTIYHEHFSYFSLLAVEHIFKAQGLMVYDVDEIKTHGGSLRVYARHLNESGQDVSARVSTVREHEITAGLDDISFYSSFGAHVANHKTALLAFLKDLKANGKRVAGYGAPAKGNTLLNYCGIGVDLIEFTVDQNPMKQGRWLPGSRIPVYAPSYIDQMKPDYIIIFPWNIADEVISQMSHVRNWGCRFIVPIPEPRIIV